MKGGVINPLVLCFAKRDSCLRKVLTQILHYGLMRPNILCSILIAMKLSCRDKSRVLFSIMLALQTSYLEPYMKQFIYITCRYCESEDLIKNGHSENGTQRYRCNACHKSFQLSYAYRAWEPGVKEQIVTQTLNSSGVRDIGRNLGISKDTVTAELKKRTCGGESVLSSSALRPARCPATDRRDYLRL